jgi:hypothetical protein
VTARSKFSAKGRARASARTHVASGCALRACASRPDVASVPLRTAATLATRIGITVEWLLVTVGIASLLLAGWQPRRAPAGWRPRLWRKIKYGG